MAFDYRIEELPTAIEVLSTKINQELNRVTPEKATALEAAKVHLESAKSLTQQANAKQFQLKRDTEGNPASSKAGPAQEVDALRVRANEEFKLADSSYQQAKNLEHERSYSH